MSAASVQSGGLALQKVAQALAAICFGSNVSDGAGEFVAKRPLSDGEPLQLIGMSPLTRSEVVEVGGGRGVVCHLSIISAYRALISTLPERFPRSL